MTCPLPFARPGDVRTLTEARHLLAAFQAIAGRPMTQEDMDRATAAAGLAYRIDVAEVRRLGMA